MPVPAFDSVSNQIIQTVRKFWGYNSLRPLQAEAIRAGLERRDSLVVMPTGGGKSLCYQVPPAVAGRTDLVVSPLISLMKDQVDGLVANGYAAAALHSGLSDPERRTIERGIVSNAYRLIFAAPERLLTSGFLQTIRALDIKTFAIDEAHCISQWGHDFRPEYRQLARLKDEFPGSSIHAYTATATPRVRQDIIAQLKLRDPSVLVGQFDRANLVYRVQPKVNLRAQVIEVVRRHASEAVIVYCISRKDTENMAALLQANAIKAAHYHAGMEKDERTKVQDEFAEERLDVVVATVAFGMGIDRSNVRCVIHAAMPKTVEHYQQETGRAGRDGLEAECVMFYSAQDFMRWTDLIALSAEKIEDPALRQTTINAQIELLDHMKRLCNSVRCRHGELSRYFGQDYNKPDCGACDVCLNELQAMPQSTIVAQKILSCVARLQQKFGVGHVIDVLQGADTELVRSFGHQSLSTYGLLRDMDEHAIRNLIYQLVDQGLLDRTPGDRPILKLNGASVAVLKEGREVTLIEPQPARLKKTALEEASWENVDRGLFEHLRELRRNLASERSVPAFVIFSDSVLRELAAIRPIDLAAFRSVRGIGEQKLADFGERFTGTIAEYCLQHALTTNNMVHASIVIPKQKMPNPTKDKAFEMFAQGAAVDEVVQQTGRALSTIGQYLEEFIRVRKPSDVSAWVDEATYQRVLEAAAKTDGSRLKPIFEALDGEVPYAAIRAVIVHAEVRVSATVSR